MELTVASVGCPPGQRGWTPCIEWCQQQWGDSDCWRFVGEGVSEFRRQEDFMLFLLKWS